MPELERLSVPRRILLDIDETLIVGRERVDRRGVPDGLGLDQPLTPRTFLLDVPAGAIAIDAPWPGGDGGTFPAWYRPGTIRALRRAHDAGVEVIWSTSWLAGDPVAIDALAAMLDLGFVRRPTVKELPIAPDRYPIDASGRVLASRHWKMQAWRHHLRQGFDTTVIDDQVYFAAADLFADPGLAAGGWIRPVYGVGFTAADAAALTRWIRQGIVPEPRRWRR